MPMHHLITTAFAVIAALIGCCLTDDVFTRLALIAGPAGVAVVLWDLRRNPHCETKTMKPIYIARMGSSVAAVLIALREREPGTLLETEEVCRLIGCEPGRVWTHLKAAGHRGVLDVFVDRGSVRVGLVEGLTVRDDPTPNGVLLQVYRTEDESLIDSAPMIQRVVSAADAAPLRVAAPRSVFELGGRAHG